MFHTDREQALAALSLLEPVDADVILPGHGPRHREGGPSHTPASGPRGSPWPVRRTAAGSRRPTNHPQRRRMLRRRH
jgi:hypothetical protein